MTVLLLVLLVSGALAWANGANDVSKGIATLVGSGVTDYRAAVLWGSAWTAVGGVLGALFAGAMLQTFGTGLLAADVGVSLAAALGTLGGAAAWVLLATRTGLPVSTTHAIVGSLVGVAALAYGPEVVQWAALGGKVALPLLLSPLVALGLSWLLLRVIGPRPGARADVPATDECLCASFEPDFAPAVGAASLASAARLELVHGSAEACAAERPTALRIGLRQMHWVTSGATCLARGMNDAPKIAALGLSAGAVAQGASASAPALFAVVGVGMVAGGLVAGRRVTRVLAEDVTPMDDREGFVANLVAAALVTTGALHGLPMSTTHVASGGIFGAGARRGTLDLGALRTIAFAWVVTLPAAAALGSLCWWVLAAVLPR